MNKSSYKIFRIETAGLGSREIIAIAAPGCMLIQLVS
jgi:hypothetical protein